MHEGLMILSKKSASPHMMFYNAPIKKIIDTFLSDDNNSDINIEPVSTAKVIGKEIFKPIKISSDESMKRSSRSKVPLTLLDKGYLSLEDIILIQ